MSNWLDVVREALDDSSEPVKFFFRDDDAGWANCHLYSLLDVFAKAQLPIDLAIIPQALEQNLADELLSRRQQNRQSIGLHQHGYGHVNHEQVGRKCEFGISRNKLQQKNDIETGQQLLHALLGDALDPFFTPPWNRCTQDTVECLEQLEFKLLSRNDSAQKLKTSRLQEVPVHVDWNKAYKTSVNVLADLGEAIAINLKNNPITGIMLHHADMESFHIKPLAELLVVIANHNNAQGMLLRDTVG